MEEPPPAASLAAVASSSDGELGRPQASRKSHGDTATRDPAPARPATRRASSDPATLRVAGTGSGRLRSRLSRDSSGSAKDTSGRSSFNRYRFGKSRRSADAVEPDFPISVPSAVKARLAQYRDKRRENNKHLTLSNLLSVTAVQRDLISTAADQPSSPRPRVRKHPDTPKSDRQNTLPLPVAVGLGHVRDPLSDITEGVNTTALTYVTPEVNKKIRKQLLKQHWFTNRF